VAREFNVLALIKGHEQYVYVYDDDSRDPLLDCFRAQAANPDLSFNWFDAAVMSQKAHEQVEKQEARAPAGLEARANRLD
jgi:hypothetical protein